MKQLLLDIAPAPAPTLDNFVPGRNRELVVALFALANNAGTERFVHIWGTDGSGRSHLLRAVAEAARSSGRNVVCFGGTGAVFDVPGNAFVAVDDVHLLDAEAQIALFNLYNRLHFGGGVLVTSSDAAPAGLALRADLLTRLAAGLVYQVHVLDDAEKVAALRSHAGARGFRLSDEVASYLLRHAQRDMPSLLALLDALDRYSLASRRAITVPLLREVLNENSEHTKSGECS